MAYKLGGKEYIKSLNCSVITYAGEITGSSVIDEGRLSQSKTNKDKPGDFEALIKNMKKFEDSHSKPKQNKEITESQRIIETTQKTIPDLQPRENYQDILESVGKMTEGQRVIENSLKILPNFQPRQK